MRKTDLNPARQKLLVPVKEHPGAHALVPPATPHVVRVNATKLRLEAAHEQLGRLQALTRALPSADLVTRTLARREAVSSSQLEGTKSGMDDLLDYEATGNPDDALPDTRLTANYVLALEEGLRELRANPKRSLDEPIIQGLHRQLMRGIKEYRDVPGKYRLHQNWIGGVVIYDARLVPPPAANVPKCMKEFAGWLKAPHDPEAPYEAGIIMRLAIAHAQFETIHPFRDGNGRVGRLILPLMLAREGYPPLYLAGYLCQRRSDYFDTLLGVQLKDNWTPWVQLIADAVRESAKEAVRLTERLLEIRTEIERQVADARIDSLLREMPSLLLSHPRLTTNTLKQIARTSFPTARAALNSLLQRKIVEVRKVGREDVYQATAIVDVLAGRSG